MVVCRRSLGVVLAAVCVFAALVAGCGKPRYEVLGKMAGWDAMAYAGGGVVYSLHDKLFFTDFRGKNMDYPVPGRELADVMWEFRLTVSPDGGRLLYKEGSRAKTSPFEHLVPPVTVKELDLRSRVSRSVVSPDCWPEESEYSPDGKKIAVLGNSRGKGYELYIASGGSVSKVYSSKTGGASIAGWLRGEDSVLLSVWGPSGRRLISVSASDGKCSTICESLPMEVPLHMRNITGDAREVLFIENDDRLVAYDLRAGSKRTIARFPDLKEGACVDVSPFGKFAAISFGLKAGSERCGVYFVDLTTGRSVCETVRGKRVYLVCVDWRADSDKALVAYVGPSGEQLREYEPARLIAEAR